MSANENLFCPYCKKEHERIYDLYVHLVSDDEKICCADHPGCSHGHAANIIGSLISRFCFDKYNNAVKPEKRLRFPAYDKTKI